MLSAILGLDAGCRESATQHGKVHMVQHKLPPAGHSVLAGTLVWKPMECVLPMLFITLDRLSEGKMCGALPQGQRCVRWSCWQEWGLRRW